MGDDIGDEEGWLLRDIASSLEVRSCVFGDVCSRTLDLDFSIACCGFVGVNEVAEEGSGGIGASSFVGDCSFCLEMGTLEDAVDAAGDIILVNSQ